MRIGPTHLVFVVFLVCVLVLATFALLNRYRTPITILPLRRLS